MMEVWVAKVIILVALFLLTLTFGLLPITVVKRLQRGHNRFSISCLNCFAGGVFLGTTLLHLLPEAREHLLESLKNDHQIETEFPITEFLVCLGFLLVLIVEGIALACGAANNIHLHDTPEDHNRKDAETELSSNVFKNSKPTLKAGSAQAKEQCTEKEPIIKPETAYPNYTGAKCSEQPCNQSLAAKAEARTDPGTSDTSDTSCNVTVSHCHNNSNQKYREQQVEYISAIVLLLAISFHSIFEGVALGLQDGNAQIWLLFGSLAVHKALIAFGMGSTFVKTFKAVKTSVIFIGIFSIIAPIGILAGIFITKYGGDSGNSVATGILQAIATGTFLYVTFFEVLGHEIGDHSKIRRTKDLLKLLASVIGFCCAVALQFLPDSD